MAFVSVCVGVLRGLMLRLLSWAKENPKTCVLYFSSFTISSLIQCIMVYRLLVRTAASVAAAHDNLKVLPMVNDHDNLKVLPSAVPW